MTATLTQIIGLEDGYRGLPLEAELRQAGVEFQRTAGVTVSYKGLPSESFVDQEAAEVVFGRTLSRGEVGCALAHQTCYANLLSSSAEWGLVFEEDARLSSPLETAQLATELATVVSATPCIIMLYGRQIVADGEAVATLRDRQLFRLARTPTTTSAYFVNRAAAALLLERGVPLKSPADWPVGVEGDIVFFAVYPWLAIPADATRESSAIGGRDGGRHPVVRVLNRLTALTGLKLLRHRKMYASARNYTQWEWHRRIVHFLARRLPYRVPDGAPSLPSASTAMRMTDNVFSTRAERAAADDLEAALVASLDTGSTERPVHDGHEK